MLADAVSLGGSGVPDVASTLGQRLQAMVADGRIQGSFCCVNGDVNAGLNLESTAAQALAASFKPFSFKWQPSLR